MKATHPLKELEILLSSGVGQVGENYNLTAKGSLK